MTAEIRADHLRATHGSKLESNLFVINVNKGIVHSLIWFDCQ